MIPNDNNSRAEETLPEDVALTVETSLGDALSSAERALWEEAILSEVKSLVKNETWEIVQKPRNRKAVGCRYVLTTKLNVDKTEKKKARLVAKGYSQRYGIDYRNTFSPVVRLDTIRLLTALAVELDMEIHQLDINTAYLNGYLDEEIYMEVPELLTECLGRIIKEERDESLKEQARKMLNDLKTGGDVCRLKKSLYGLKQAGRQWNKRLDNKLKSMHFKQSLKEPCLYYLDGNSIDTSIYLAVYVDDLLIVSRNKGLIQSFKDELSKEFDLKDYGLAKYILGIDIVKNEYATKLSQQKYINDLMIKFGMENCKETVTTPMEVNFRPNGSQIPLEKKCPYRELIGSLIYLSAGTRPDITHAVTRLAAFCDNPGQIQWNAVKRLLRYLKRTADYGLIYRKTGKSLIGYSDADWANCPIDRKSYSGYAFLLGGAAISWKSQKQKCVATSTCEAEYISLNLAIKEAVYLNSLMKEIGLRDFGNIVLYCDNQGALFLSEDPVFHARTKHFDIQYYFIRSVLRENTDIQLSYVSTEEMAADVLTKALQRQKHYRCISMLGVD
ncbi:unnamed protein product [Pieris macdunnoughi]|nr:unnamed protein product [Pieris macdunnoughi]